MLSPFPQPLPLTSGQANLLRAFLALGIIARLLRYLLRFPLWGDESYLAANFLPTHSGSILEPLGWGQVAPPFFLYLERSVTQLLGFDELSLRLLPVLAGIGGLFLFARICQLTLSGWPRILAVATFCVSYYPTRHAAEVKPYAFDLFFALLLLLLALEWLRTEPRARYGWLLAAVLPFAIWLSYPAAFIGGGVLLALFPRFLAGVGRAPFVAAALALFGSFAALYHLSAGAQMDHESYMFDIWSHTFLPWREPLRVIPWLFEVHSGRMMAHPVGGSSGGSAATLLLFVVGAVALFRARQRRLLALLLLPFAVHLFASALQAYPYGGSARWMLHLSPAISLLFGLGLATLLRVLSTPRATPAVVTTLGLLAAIGSFTTVRALVKPYKNRHDQTALSFARWYWSDRADGAVRLDLSSDLGWNLFPTFPEGSPAQYLCNLNVVRGPAPDREEVLRRLRDGVVLRVAFCHPRDHEIDRSLESAWLTRMEEDFELLSRAPVDLPRHRRGKVVRVERIETFEFMPRDRGRVLWPGREREGEEEG